MRRVEPTREPVTSTLGVTARSWASSPAVRAVMRGNRKRDTKPELVLRRQLHALGYRYLVAARPLGGRFPVVDVLFPKRKVAVFVDGCFWHGCSQHYVAPTRNAQYWVPKIARNQARDADSNRLLASAGWTVIRLWEHEPPQTAIQRVIEAL
jgi:DNA mismatch endonuclease (patch repair protein)